MIENKSEGRGSEPQRLPKDLREATAGAPISVWVSRVQCLSLAENACLLRAPYYVLGFYICFLKKVGFGAAGTVGLCQGSGPVDWQEIHKYTRLWNTVGTCAKSIAGKVQWGHLQPVPTHATYGAWTLQSDRQTCSWFSFCPFVDDSMPESC